MTYRINKPVLAALMATGLVAGCATTVDMGGPLGHYRYNYDSRPVISESTVVPSVSYRASPTVTYQNTPTVTYETKPTVTYQTPPTVTYQAAPTVTYRTAPSVTYEASPTVRYRERIVYRDPTLRYYEPTVVYEWNPSPSLSYTDHGQ